MIVVTLGGNAIIPTHGTGTFAEQVEITRLAMSGVAELIGRGERVVVSHGNGPIVGNIVMRNEAAKETIAPMPLDVCGADSQGGIGYMLQQTLGNELVKRGLDCPVASVVTQCLVRADDPQFHAPSKPIGPFYSAGEAEKLARERDWTVVEDSGRGYRHVVPSPHPLEIVEVSAIESLIASGVVAIAGGGGGVPVVREADGTLRGVEGVIDKDRSASVLARQIGAKRLAVLTAVEHVAVDFGRPDERALDRMTVREARRFLREGQFPSGSMGPKVEACLEFVEAGGRDAVITSAGTLVRALDGAGGTRITADAGSGS